MDFEKLISFAEQVQESNTKDGVAKKFYKKPPAAPSRKEEKKAKGIESEAVKAFLEKQKREEEEKAAKEKKRKQAALKTQLEANEKRDGDELKQKEAAKFVPSDFATGPRQRVGAAIARPSKAVVTVNPCLVKAPNPCLVKAPNPCLVKAPNPCLVKDSEKAASSSSADTSQSKEDRRDTKHKSKHKHKDREKTAIIKNALEAIADKHRQASIGVKTEGVSVMKKKKKHVAKKGPEKPPLSFEQLLQIAQKKHTVPVDIIPVAKPKKVIEETRPMTKEEKERHMRRHSNAYQAWLKFGKRPSEEKRTGTPDRKAQKLSEEAGSNSRNHAQTTDKKRSKTKPSSEVAADNANSKLQRKTRRRRRTLTATTSPGSSFKKWHEAETNRHSKPSGDVGANKVRLKTETSDREIPADVQRGDVRANMNGCNKSSQQSVSKNGHKPPVTVARVSTNNSSQQSVSKTGHKNHDTIARVSTNNSSQQSVSKTGHKNHDTVARVSTNNSSQQSVSKTGHKNHDTVARVSTNNSSQQSVSKAGHKNHDTVARMSTNNSSQQNVSKHKPPVTVARNPTTAPPGCTNGSRQSSGTTSKASKTARGSGQYISTRETVLKCGSPAVKANSVPEKAKKPVSSWDRIYGEIQKNNPLPVRRKRQIEEEEAEEEDSEDDGDDFIADDDDDDAAGGVDYSKYIKDIFGYDKTRFRNERQDDLRDMESSFSQVAKEERISARLGLREDLDDIHQEEEKKKRKMMKNSKQSKFR